MLNGIAGAHHHSLLKAGDGMDHLFLHMGRKPRRDAVRIILKSIQPLRLQENMMGWLSARIFLIYLRWKDNSARPWL